MALTFDQAGGDSKARGWAANLGLAYAWSGFAVMWVFWVCFVIFLTDPSRLASYWPLPTVDRGGVVEHPVAAALIDLALIALFGLQHSLMARPWFKTWWAASIPPAFERCTYVHMANLALFALIIFWQPIPGELWNVSQDVWRDALWTAFAGGWILLFLGARSFGVVDLLGVQQMRRWTNGAACTGASPEDRLAVPMAATSHVRGSAAGRMGDAEDEHRARLAGPRTDGLRPELRCVTRSAIWPIVSVRLT